MTVTTTVHPTPSFHHDCSGGHPEVDCVDGVSRHRHGVFLNHVSFWSKRLPVAWDNLSPQCDRWPNTTQLLLPRYDCHHCDCHHSSCSPIHTLCGRVMPFVTFAHIVKTASIPLDGRDDCRWTVWLWTWYDYFCPKVQSVYAWPQPYHIVPGWQVQYDLLASLVVAMSIQLLVTVRTTETMYGMQYEIIHHSWMMIVGCCCCHWRSRGQSYVNIVANMDCE